MLNNDYKDILLALSNRKVKFLLIGAYAMAAHGYPRSTIDINKRATGRTKDLADAELLEEEQYDQ